MNGLISSSVGHTHIHWIDAAIVVAYLAGSTWLGAKLSGRPATIRDFFLGGRKLPWWAVAGSNIAVEVSAVTFIGVPALSFAAGGDFRYLQLALGAVLARLIVAYVLVPAYYRREIYSPYEFMGQRLGAGVDKASTALFMLGAMLAQGVRLFIAALVLEVVTGLSLGISIWVIGAFAIAWTLLGGITTVIWTDVIQFVLLIGGAVVSLFFAFHSVPEGVSAILHDAAAAGKFRVFDFSADPARVYTLWSGLFGMTFLNLAALGTDQVMAQRMFCCRGEAEARRATLASLVGLLVPILMLFVGVGLFAYFRKFPMTPYETGLVAERADRVFPIFIVKVLPPGVTGLVMATIFAAAISALTGTLAALSQTAVTSFYLTWRTRGKQSSEPGRHTVWVSRMFVVIWGLVLCAAATAIAPFRQYRHLIDLALAVPGYTYGALLGMLLMALLPGQRDDRGLVWAVPASVLAVLSMSTQAVWASYVVVTGVGVLLLMGVARLSREPRAIGVLVVILAAIVALRLMTMGVWGLPRVTLAYAWFYPVATSVTFVLGLALARGGAADAGRTRATH